MVTGHIAATYVAAGIVRDKRMLWLVPIAYLSDALDVLLALAGVCNAYGMYTHSLPALAVLAPLTMLGVWGITRDRRFALVALALVLVHLPLDWVTSRKALWPYGPLVGMDLYSIAAADLTIETVLMVAAWLWSRSRTSPDSTFYSNIAIVLLLALQCIVYVLSASKFKPPITSQSPSCKTLFFERKG